MKETFQKIQEKLTDKTWTELQDPEFIKSLTRIEDVITQLSTQVFVFIDYFEQYVDAIQKSPVFSAPDDSQFNDSQSTNPTQTIPEPVHASSESLDGNRAERRSKEHKKTKPQGISYA